MNSNNLSVAILLVIYNEAQFIPNLIASLKKQTYPKIKIYAIDNNSIDDSILIIKKLLPEVFIIESNENHGFAKANNILAEKASEDNVEYLFVLNTDMILDVDCIKELVSLAESDKAIGAIAPIVLIGKRNEKTNIIQCYVDKANFKTGKTTSPHSNLNFRNVNLPEKIEVNTVHGGATFIKTEVYKKVGLFNEDNFMYGDELDLAYRIKQTGYKMLVTKKAVGWHFHNWSKTNKKANFLQYYYMTRNRFLFFHRYKKYKSLIIGSLKELLNLPLIIRWAIRRVDIKIIKYYYLGILHGLLNKKGKADIEFK